MTQLTHPPLCPLPCPSGCVLCLNLKTNAVLVVIMVAIFPGVLKLEMSRKPGDSAGRCVGWLLILFGIAVGVVSLVVEILKLTS